MVDTKDWTWVLQQRCPECGFDAAAVRRDEIGEALRAVNAQLIGLLGDGQGDLVTRRPSGDVWSAAEYGCHVRDVLRLYLYRLHLMVEHHAPTFPNWDQDEAAASGDYSSADVHQLIADLTADGEALAEAFDAVHDDEWERSGLRSDGARFTIESFARYLLHDPTHHVWDIERGYERLR